MGRLERLEKKIAMIMGGARLPRSPSVRSAPPPSTSPVSRSTSPAAAWCT